MPLLRVKEIRDMSPDNRIQRLSEFRTELTRLRTMIGAGGMVENPARIRELRKSIARLLTIQAEDKRKGVGIKSRERKKK